MGYYPAQEIQYKTIPLSNARLSHHGIDTAIMRSGARPSVRFGLSWCVDYHVTHGESASLSKLGHHHKVEKANNARPSACNSHPKAGLALVTIRTLDFCPGHPDSLAPGPTDFTSDEDPERSQMSANLI